MQPVVAAAAALDPRIGEARRVLADRLSCNDLAHIVERPATTATLPTLRCLHDSLDQLAVACLASLSTESWS